MKRLVLGAAMMAALVAGVTLAPADASAAGRYPHDITLTPHNPLPVSSAYHVKACSLKRNTQTVVDTTGPGTFFTRRSYMSDAGGCINYDDVTGPIAGTYLITVQQVRGSNLAVTDWATFLVQ